MQIDLICIGKIKEPYLREGIAEYLTRLTGMVQIRITEFPEERVRTLESLSDIANASRQEGIQLLKAGGEGRLLIALDQAGKRVTSDELAAFMKRWEIDGPHQIAILIGGPHGFSEEVRKKADILISLSAMTFPHQMVRLIILEQIYRAFTIIKGLPYHR